MLDWNWRLLVPRQSHRNPVRWGTTVGVWTFSLCGSAALRRPFPCPFGLGHISMTRLVSGACWKPSGILLVPDRSTAEMLHREDAPPPHSSPAVYQKLELYQQHNLLHNVTPHLNDQMSGKDQAQVQSSVDVPNRAGFFLLRFLWHWSRHDVLQFCLYPSGGTLLRSTRLRWQPGLSKVHQCCCFQLHRCGQPHLLIGDPQIFIRTLLLNSPYCWFRFPDWRRGYSIGCIC